jgi:hypothetical protein
MIEVVFTSDFATYKAKEKAFFKSNLASLIVSKGVAKLTTKKKPTKQK